MNKDTAATYQMRCKGCKRFLVWSSVDETQIKTDVLVCYECNHRHSIKAQTRNGNLKIGRKK